MNRTAQWYGSTRVVSRRVRRLWRSNRADKKITANCFFVSYVRSSRGSSVGNRARAILLEGQMDCPECGEELDYLDKIFNKITREVVWVLYICHNEDCNFYGGIYHEVNGEPVSGDPSDCY